MPRLPRVIGLEHVLDRLGEVGREAGERLLEGVTEPELGSTPYVLRNPRPGLLELGSESVESKPSRNAAVTAAVLFATLRLA